MTVPVLTEHFRCRLSVDSCRSDFRSKIVKFQGKSSATRDHACDYFALRIVRDKPGKWTSRIVRLDN